MPKVGAGMHTDVKVDLYSSASYDGGHPLDQYEVIRNTEGLYWHEELNGPGFWAVGRHADANAVSRATHSFTSWQGTFMWDMDEASLAMMRQFMLLMDPPRHSFYRRLATPAFTPRRAQSSRDAVVKIVNGLLDDVAERDEFCLVRDLIGALPLYVIADVLGFPRSEALQMYDHMRVIAAAPDSVTEAQRSESLTTVYTFGMQLGHEKRRSPGDDLSSVLVRGEVDGAQLREEEFAAFFLLLVDAGADTTRNSLGAGLIQLMADPDQWQALRDGSDALLATAANEILRWSSPVVHMRRTATQDIEIGGQLVREGEKVVLFYGAANHDPTVFENPQRFDITRAKNPHVAFGSGGPHVCLGAHLARLEIQEMLRGILGRLRPLEQTGPATWDQSNYIIGPETVPVRQS
ncbi:MAG TPA: cytochrome P450 [Pseudonocardia sp.]|nr:cytochrome P450 [Pseudonocardia sp.]